MYFGGGDLPLQLAKKAPSFGNRRIPEIAELTLCDCGHLHHHQLWHFDQASAYIRLSARRQPLGLPQISRNPLP
jgi:hypothetical protein